MRAKLIQMGNSRGVRLPKPLIEEVGLGNVVELRVRSGAIVISPERKPRRGWAEAAQDLSAHGEDRLIETAPTAFAAKEWKW